MNNPVTEIYNSLRELANNDKTMREDAIREAIGDDGFNMLVRYRRIEYDGIDNNGNKYYFI